MKITRIIILIIVFALMSSSVCFAIYTSGEAIANVDLSKSNFECVAEHTDLSSEDAQISIEKKSNQLVASCDIPISDNPYEIQISTDGFYKYSGSQRPFGIDAVLYLIYDDTEVAIEFGGAGTGHYGNYNIKSPITMTVRNQIVEGQISSAEELRKQLRGRYFFLRAILFFEYMEGEWYKKYPGNIFDWFEGFYNFIYKEYVQKTPLKARLDLYLVLPELGNYESQMLYSPDNEYTATVTVSGGTVHEEIKISGNYTNTSDDISVAWTINGNDESKSIDLNREDIVSGGSGISIGTYSYVISMTSRYQTVDFYAFLSSSSDPHDSGTTFLLSKDNYSFAYEAGLSTSSNSGPVWFDGSDGFSLDSESIDGYNLLALGTSNFSGEANRTYSGEGDILFRLASGVDEDSIPAGTYESDIYFHVIADL